MFNSKKIISLIISGVIAMQVVTSTFGTVKAVADVESVTTSVYTEELQPTPANISGDANKDGNVNSIDFALMRVVLLGIKSVETLSNHDVSGDGNFNAIDFAYMRKYLLGMITEFPIDAQSSPSTATPTATPTQTVNFVFKVIENEETSITFSWDSVVNAKGYEICADGILTKSLTGTSYEHTGLIKNTWHSYKVRAKFENNESEWSEVLRICTAPQKPIEVYGDVTSGSTAIITWENVTGAANYQILRNDATTPIVVEQPSYEATDLVLGTNYTYEVKAIDSNGFEMGNSGRILVNTGEVRINNADALYENRVYGKSLIVGNLLYLNKYKVKVEGDLSQSGNVNIDGGRLYVSGNYCIEDYGKLIMQDDSGDLIINGDFTTKSISKSLATDLSAGTIRILGDFYQYTGQDVRPTTTYTIADNFRTSGKHKVIMSNNVSHKLFFENPGYSFINILELEGDVSGKTAHVEFTNNNYLSANVLRSNMCILKSITIGNKMRVEGSIVIDGNLENHSSLDLNGNIVNVNGSVINKGTLDLNSGKLIVNGNESMGIEADFKHRRGMVFINGGYLEVKHNFEMGNDPTLGDSYAELKMQNENDYIKVFGDFSTRTISEQDISLLSAGTMEIKGDFYQYRGRDLRPNGFGTTTYYQDLNFRATGTHKVFMSGDKKQKIYFESPSFINKGTHYNYSTFNILCINKPLDDGYSFEYPNNKTVNNQPWNSIEEINKNANLIP